MATKISLTTATSSVITSEKHRLKGSALVHNLRMHILHFLDPRLTTDGPLETLHRIEQIHVNRLVNGIRHRCAIAHAACNGNGREGEVEELETDLLLTIAQVTELNIVEAATGGELCKDCDK